MIPSTQVSQRLGASMPSASFDIASLKSSLLSPEKQRQLAAILNRIEALLESGGFDPGSMLAQSNNEKAVVLRIGSSHGSEAFLEQATRVVAQMHKARHNPDLSKIDRRKLERPPHKNCVTTIDRC
jgi:hypothetical protein